MALRDFNLNLVANVPQTLVVDGDFFGVYEAQNYVYISLDNGPDIKRTAGNYQTGKYNTVIIRSLVNQTVVLQLGYGAFFSSNQNVTVNTTTIVEPGNSNPALDDVVVPAGGSIQIVGANLIRKSVIIKSLYSNDPSSIVRVGIGAAAAKGAELIAGDALPPIESTGAIDAYNPGALDVTLSITEINKV